MSHILHNYGKSETVSVAPVDKCDTHSPCVSSGSTPSAMPDNSVVDVSVNRNPLSNMTATSLNPMLGSLFNGATFGNNTNINIHVYTNAPTSTCTK